MEAIRTNIFNVFLLFMNDEELFREQELFSIYLFSF